MGRWLVLGGTRFLSRAVASAAVARGHEVLCAARGTSGAVPDGAQLVAVDRDAPGALDGLRGERFDAVVDVARMSYPWVRDAVAALDAAHWTFVSSISAYCDQSRLGGSVTDPVFAPLQSDELTAGDDPDSYGAVKVASENAVRDVRGDDALVVRAGLICGPDDLSDRFGWWPLRFAAGGPTVVPDVLDQPMQIIDVRDLAAWIVACGEGRTVGTFDGSGPRSTVGTLLDEIADAVGAADLSRVPIAPDVLEAAEVTPWAGPTSLPLWLPPSHVGLGDHDTSPAAAAGLRCRPVGDTARDALDYERTLDPLRQRKAGLTAAEEHELLSAARESRA